MSTRSQGIAMPAQGEAEAQEPDGTYGYTLADLLAVQPCAEPPGFAAHWRARYDDARAVQANPQLTPAGRRGDHDLYTVTFTTTEDRVLGGWLALPADGMVRRGVVSSHGYGGREGPDGLLVEPGTAVMWPVSRGQSSASLTPDLPSEAQAHVLVGIDSVQTYILGGCAEDVWCATSALTEIVGDVPLQFVGGSFGGGQGALALPWDDRFVAAALRVPSFGQYDLRLSMPCLGSGESVRHHVAAHPEAREVLRFFDASAAAGRIKIPTLVACALRDPAVPPPGQFAVYNAIPGASLYVMTAGHTEYPGQEAEVAAWEARVSVFLRAQLP